MLGFVVKFFVFMVALFAINMLRPVQEHVIIPWSNFLAAMCSWLVTTFDPSVVAYGKVLMNPKTGFGVSIEPGCNGVEACLVLFAAVLAYPATWRSRLFAMVVGVLAIQSVNVVRVISLFYIGQWNQTAFLFAHEYLWQALIMLDVLVVWLFWVRANPDRLLPPAPVPSP